MGVVLYDTSFKGTIYYFSLNNCCNNPLERTLIIIFSKSNPIQSLRFENTDSKFGCAHMLWMPSIWCAGLCVILTVPKEYRLQSYFFPVIIVLFGAQIFVFHLVFFLLLLIIKMITQIKIHHYGILIQMSLHFVLCSSVPCPTDLCHVTCTSLVPSLHSVSLSVSMAHPPISLTFPSSLKISSFFLITPFLTQYIHTLNYIYITYILHI